MNSLFSLRAMLILLASILVMSGCDLIGDDDDSDEEASLVGTYDLESVRDNTGEFTGTPGTIIVAGVPFTTTVDFGGESFTFTLEISGTLTLSENTYQFAITSTQSFDSDPPETDTEIDSGTWTRTSTSITTVSDTDEEEPTETFQYDLDGDVLTLSDTESRLVFRRR